MRLINGMTDGYKEINLHRNKKKEYKADIERAAGVNKEKIYTASIRYVNAFLIGESMLILLLGIVVLAIPRLFPGIPTYTIMSFVLVVLYLSGPVNAELRAVPVIMQMVVSWRRLKGFMEAIPASLHVERTDQVVDRKVKNIKVEDLRFKYKNVDEQDGFGIGPINLEVNNGEILFIIGGNGSGKTTLTMLLTGLYSPDEGRILINDQEVASSQLSEYFSAVFNPLFLFDKLYNVDVEAKSGMLKKYLSLLHLEDKVEVSGNKYSTINLSGGQRKRLALLQCYLEDSPIYLFDEWAADQDPEYRNFFYRILLPEMKRAGKIVIAITHDDHYFDVADKVVKMKMGNMEVCTDELLPVSGIRTSAIL
jgi:cyclic peptide transporter